MTTAPRWHELAEAFALGPVRGTPEYVTRGSMGEIWRLETSLGRWAAKWQFPWAPAEPRPADIRVQAAAAAAGISLPSPATAPDGAAVIPVGGRLARVYEWVDLAAPLQAPVPVAAAAEAGQLLGLLHRLAIPATEPEDPWFTQAPAPLAWDELASRAAAARRPWASRLAVARRLIDDLTAFAIASPQPLVACHRDFNPDNVLPARADGTLIVLDWENAGRLDPRRELGYALFAWCSGGGRPDRGAADAMKAAYADASGFAAGPEAGLYATAVAVHLNFLHVMATQALDDLSHRAYAEQAVAALLDDDLNDLGRLLGLRT